MTRIALINPRFEISYWGMEHVVQIAGKQANMPAAALPLLAALTPDTDSIILVDENVQEIDYSVFDNVDIVGITGMNVQRHRMKEILQALKQRGKFTVVGGAWVSVQEDYFGDLADVIFVGEADESWPAFLEDWRNRNWQPRYEQAAKTDVTKLPAPRFDLLKMDRYLNGSIQISRGCPFLCEFCDIIVTFGRRPRVKTSTQIIAELEILRAAGVNTIFIVDDNFIGNKHAIKEILKDIIAYQQANGFWFRFFTEASLDLAEDEELMRMMTDANILAVFIGIESPNEDSLKETRKNQNVRPRAGTMLQRVHKVLNAGIEVRCGMIVGFDNDDEKIFDAQRRFLNAAYIPHVLLGMLFAIPKTPLHARLIKEGRLDPTDVPEYGTNVIPKRLSREALQRGYMILMRSLNEPESYFSRLEELYLRGRLHREKLGSVAYLRHRPLRRIKSQMANSIGSVLFFRRLMKHVKNASLKKEYRRRIWQAAKTTRDPGTILTYVLKCAVHYHTDRLISDLETGAASPY